MTEKDFDAEVVGTSMVHGITNPHHPYREVPMPISRTEKLKSQVPEPGRRQQPLDQTILPNSITNSVDRRPSAPIDMPDFLGPFMRSPSLPPSPMDLDEFLSDPQNQRGTRLSSPIDDILGELMEQTPSAATSHPVSGSTPPSPIDMSFFFSSKPPSSFDDPSVQSPPISSSNTASLTLRIAPSDPPSPLPLDQFMDCPTAQGTLPAVPSVSGEIGLTHSDPPSPLPLDQFMDFPTVPSVSGEIRLTHSDPPSPLPLDEFMDSSAFLGRSLTDLSVSIPLQQVPSDPPSPLPLDQFMDFPTVPSVSSEIRLTHSDPPSPLPLDEFMDSSALLGSLTDLCVLAESCQIHSDPPSPLPLDQFMDFPNAQATSPTAPSVSAEICRKHSDPPSPLPLTQFMDESTLLAITSGHVRSEEQSINRTTGPPDSIGHLPQHARSVLDDRILLLSYRRVFDVDGTRWSSLYASNEPGVDWSRNVLNLFASEIWFKRYHHFWKNPILNWSFVDMPHASLKLCKRRSVNSEDISFEKLTAVLLQRETFTPEEDLEILAVCEEQSSEPQFPRCGAETMDMSPQERADCRRAEWFGPLGGVADLVFMASHTCHPSIVQGRMDFPITAFTRHFEDTLPDPPTSQNASALQMKAIIQCESVRERIAGTMAYSREYFGVDIHKEILAHSLCRKRGVFD